MSSSVVCPNCEFRMTVKGVAPGRYRPVCKRCGERFSLTVPPEPAEPRVRRLPDADASATSPKTSPAATAGAKNSAAKNSAAKNNAAKNSAAKNSEAKNSEAKNSEATKNAATDATTDATAKAATNAAATNAAAADAAATSGVAETQAGWTSRQAPTEQIEETVAGDPGRSLQSAAAARPGAAEDAAEASPELVGYQVVRVLGQGAMGRVYLARQLSLDRLVAVKVLQSRWLADPVQAARFIREAYAAAQLTHHNIVQVHDLGRHQGVAYFSMEYVDGRNLSQLIQEAGRIDVATAATYMLQAARGLQCAHQHGMVHRDVKPANLLLDPHGLIKVADLGLVKTDWGLEVGLLSEATTTAAPPPSRARSDGPTRVPADITRHNSTLGTAAFMAPEQADDASKVDHRADIYSLGCTFYTLLAGRPPFDGESALDVISKHKSEPFPDLPERELKGLSGEIAVIIGKMTAKSAADRYSNLGAVIDVLERFLGVSENDRGPLDQPRADRFQELADTFQSAPAAARRKQIGRIAAAGAAGGVAIGVLAGSPWLCATGLGLLLATALSAALGAAGHRPLLLERLRSLAMLASWSQWLAWLAGAGMLAALAVISGLTLPLAWALTLGAAGAVLWRQLLEKPLAQQRQPSLELAEQLLLELRMRGVDEPAVQRFAAQHAGDHWEAFFEALFGYAAMREMRQLLRRGVVGRTRRKHAPWRDGLIDWLDARIERRRRQREHRHLKSVEREGLAAQGLSAQDAEDRADAVAQSLVDLAAKARAPRAGASPDEDAAERREKIKSMLAQTRMEGKARSGRLRHRLSKMLDLALGGSLRFLAGCVLLTVSLLWLRQNDALSVDGMRAAAEHTWGSGDAAWRPLALAGPLGDSLQPGVAGLLLILTASGGWTVALCALPAAAALLLGPLLGAPDVALLGGARGVSAAAGALWLAATWILWGRRG